MSNFAFLQPEWAQLAEPAGKAEQLALPGPRTACFHARRALELAVSHSAECGVPGLKAPGLPTPRR